MWRQTDEAKCSTATRATEAIEQVVLATVRERLLKEKNQWPEDTVMNKPAFKPASNVISLRKF